MAKSTSSRAKSVLGGHSKSAKKSGSKKPHSIHIHRGKSGGFLVTHHHKAAAGEMAPEPEDHVVPDLDSLHDHLDQHMGDQPPAEMSAPEPAPAAAGPGPGGPAPQAPIQGM